MPYNDTDFLILVTFSEEMVFGFIEERYEEALRSAMNGDLKKMNNHLSIIFRGIVILSSCFQNEYKEFLEKFGNQ